MLCVYEHLPQGRVRAQTGVLWLLVWPWPWPFYSSMHAWRNKMLLPIRGVFWGSASRGSSCCSSILFAQISLQCWLKVRSETNFPEPHFGHLQTTFAAKRSAMLSGCFLFMFQQLALNPGEKCLNNLSFMGILGVSKSLVVKLWSNLQHEYFLPCKTHETTWTLIYTQFVQYYDCVNEQEFLPSNTR